MKTSDKPVAYFEYVEFDAVKVLDEGGVNLREVTVAICYKVLHPVLGFQRAVGTSMLVSAPDPDCFETMNTKYVRNINND